MTQRTVSGRAERARSWKTEGMDRPDPRSSSRPATAPTGIANPRRTRLSHAPAVRVSVRSERPERDGS